jgi:hypothetical protein
MLRRRLAGVMITQPGAHGQLALGFVEIDAERQEAWEYAVLVTSLDAEVLTIGQLYRDRGDCENSFDELKNHWGWGGFTTHDMMRCRIMARMVALIFNWWNLFVRLADPDHHREAITSRPLLLQAIGRQINHAGRATVTISSMHGERGRARRALTRIAQAAPDQAGQTGARSGDAGGGLVRRWRRLARQARRGPVGVAMHILGISAFYHDSAGCSRIR